MMLSDARPPAGGCALVLVLLLMMMLLLLLLITRCSFEIAVKAGVLGCGMLAYRFVGL